MFGLGQAADQRKPVENLLRHAPTFRRWFTAHRPDVVIAQSPSAPIIRGWLEEAGALVPATCGFADFDVDPTPGSSSSGIRQNYEQVAAAAVDLVVAQILRNEHGIPAFPKVVLIEGDWVDGDTTRAQTEGPGNR